MPKPLSDAKRAEILSLHGQGLTRNEIARQSGVSVGSVTNVCRKSGATFDRSQTKDATEARKVDLAEARMNLAYRLNTAALDMLDMLDKPFEVFNFGGKDNTFASQVLDSVPVEARRTIITSTAIVFDKITRIVEKSDDGLEDALGVADKLAAGFEEIARIARATQETLSDES
jgi:hypothetical protein